MSHPTYSIDQQRAVCREAREKLAAKTPGKSRFLYFGCAFVEADTVKLAWGKVSQVAATDAFLVMRSQSGGIMVATERLIEHTWGERQVSQLMRKHGVTDLQAAA